MEGGVDVLELPGEDGLHLPGDLGDDGLQLLFGLLHVVPLVRQIGVPLIHPLELLDGPHVHACPGRRCSFSARRCGGWPWGWTRSPAAGACRLVGQLIVLPQLVQQLLLLQGGGGLLLLQSGGLSAQGQQLLVLLLPSRVAFTRSPSRDSFSWSGGRCLVLPLVLPANGLQAGLLLPDLPGKGGVLLLIAADEGPALLLVPGDVSRRDSSSSRPFRVASRSASRAAARR